MGQQLVGQYPIHFHLAGDLDQQGGYDPPTYVRELSIHHTFSRCVTVHGSNGLLVSTFLREERTRRALTGRPAGSSLGPGPQGWGCWHLGTHSRASVIEPSSPWV